MKHLLKSLLLFIWAAYVHYIGMIVFWHAYYTVSTSEMIILLLLSVMLLTGSVLFIIRGFEQ